LLLLPDQFQNQAKKIRITQITMGLHNCFSVNQKAKNNPKQNRNTTEKGAEVLVCHSSTWV